MITVKEIIEIIEAESVQENSSCNNRILIHQDFESVAEQIVKKLTLYGVSNSVICCPQCGNERLESTGGGWYICSDRSCIGVYTKLLLPLLLYNSNIPEAVNTS